MIILTYGAETWTWMMADITRSEAADMRFLIKGNPKWKENIKKLNSLNINALEGQVIK
jgi:hypothetical protein